jgi:ribosome biogenesis GTPase
MNSSIKDYGFDSFFETQIEEFKISDNNVTVARVIEVQREQYKIAAVHGEKNARLKGSIFYDNKEVLYPTVGDFVLVSQNPCGDDVIYHVLQEN